MATVVVLNGTSSSGKTTLARAFQEIAPSLFLNFSIDSILYALPQRAIDQLIAEGRASGVRYEDVEASYYGCVRELAGLGHDLITDNAVVTAAQAKRLVDALEGHRVLMVLVSCSEEVLCDRERARGDRNIGLASRQLGQIERWLQYDLRIDTSVDLPSSGAEAIMNALRGGDGTAFARTRDSLPA